MKKLLVLAAVAAMAMGVKAEYTISQIIFAPSNAEGGWTRTDETSGAENYQLYLITSSLGLEGTRSYVQGSTVEAINQSALRHFDLSVKDGGGWPVLDYSRDWGEGAKYDLWVDYPGVVVEAGGTTINIDDPTQAYVVAYYGADGGSPSEVDVLYTIPYGDGILFRDDEGSGWMPYTAPTPVPEPTSGLLLLLGVAGLVLKRKRA